MVTAWKALALSAVLAVDVVLGQQCNRKEEADSSSFFSILGESGLESEDGVSTLAANIRTGFHSLPEPQAYAIVGGGEWGPRMVARALLESVMVDWSTDVLVLDMMDEDTDEKGNRRRVFWGSDSGLQEAQTRLNTHLCDAIMRCPGRAAVVLDNVHLLEGEDIRVLDTMLSLLDGAKSNMDCRDGKVSGEGSLFLLLLNEEGSEETKRLKGKERLLEAWKFKGLEFTTSAFVGRMDAAVSLSEKPRQLVPGMEDAWRHAKAWPPVDSGSIASALRDFWERAVGVLKDHPNLAVAGAATATILVAGHWCFRNAHVSGQDRDTGRPADENTGSNRKGSDKGGEKVSNGLSAMQKAVRKRGGGVDAAPANVFDVGGGGSGGGGRGGASGAGARKGTLLGAESEPSGEKCGDGGQGLESAESASGGEADAVFPEFRQNGDQWGEAAAEGPAHSTRSRGRRHETGTGSSRRTSTGRRKSRGSRTSARNRSSSRSGRTAAKAAGGGAGP